MLTTPTEIAPKLNAEKEKTTATHETNVEPFEAEVATHEARIEMVDPNGTEKENMVANYVRPKIEISNSRSSCNIRRPN